MKVKKLIREYEKTKIHYSRLDMDYGQGLIPTDIYIQELTIVKNHLEKIYKELQHIKELQQ